MPHYLVFKVQRDKQGPISALYLLTGRSVVANENPFSVLMCYYYWQEVIEKRRESKQEENYLRETGDRFSSGLVRRGQKLSISDDRPCYALNVSTLRMENSLHVASARKISKLG